MRTTFLEIVLALGGGALGAAMAALAKSVLPAGDASGVLAFAVGFIPAFWAYSALRHKLRNR